MFCKDPFTKKLHASGFNAVLLPRSNVLPLQVIGAEMFKRSMLGSITNVFTSSETVPAPVEGHIVGLDVNESAVFKAKVGFKVLERFASALNLNVPKLQAAYKGAHTLQFSMGQPRHLSIELAVISKYLAKAEMIESGPLMERFFLKGGYSLHLITEVLQTKTFAVRATDATETEFEADLDAAQIAASGNTKVRRESSTSSNLVYEGTNEITFAFKSIEIGLENGHWTMKGFSPIIDLSKGSPAQSPQWDIPEEGRLVDLTP